MKACFVLIDQDGRENSQQLQVEEHLRSNHKIVTIDQLSPLEFVMDYVTAINEGTTPLVLNPNISTVAKQQIMSSVEHKEREKQGHYLCTSGTTGNLPKTFFFSLDRPQMNAQAHLKSLALDEFLGCKILFPLPLFHSFGVVVGIWGTFALEASLYCFRTFPTMQELSRILQEKQIEILYLTPSLGRLILRYKEYFCTVKSLKKISIGAATLYQDELLELMRLFPNVQFYYTYGLTEMGPRVFTFSAGCLSQYSSLLLDCHREVPLGKTLENIEYKIVDKILHIRTPYRSDDLDDVDFFSTGDVIQQGENQIYFIGRRNTTINFAGRNIYPQDVESLFEKCSGLERVALVPQYSPFFGEIPVLLLQTTTDFSSDLFFDYVKKNCPQTLLPKRYLKVSSIPVSEMGKVKLQAVNKILRNHLYSEISWGGERLPERKLEKNIARIWEDVLRESPIFMESDFFLLGGDSLLAVELLAKINKLLHLNLTIDLLFTSPVFAQFISKVEENQRLDNQKFHYLVPIHAGTSNTYDLDSTLIFFHAIGGNPLNYLGIAQMLPEYTSYGFRSRGVDGYKIGPCSIPQMAECYTYELLNTVHNSNIILIGGSFGGAVAYEVACKLQQYNHNVQKVILLDTGARGSVAAITTGKTGYWTEWKARLVLRLALFINTIYLKIKRPIPFYWRQQLIEHFHLQARYKYVPQKFNGDIYLIRATDNCYQKTPAADLGWGEFVSGEVHCFQVDAPHATFIENYAVEQLVTKIISNSGV